jgi:O-acetyl-ADP-ribose deacetylase (regulator of RNase III)
MAMARCIIEKLFGMSDLRLILVDPHPGVCRSFERAFRGLSGVAVAQTYFEHLAEFDCVVSPANSFGLLDSGIDHSVSDFFGEALAQRVQERILDEFLGEQPVGTSLIVETGHPQHPYIAHTPTMRYPAPAAETDSAYTAMWAALLAVRRHNRSSPRAIRLLACPDLGAAAGWMRSSETARQMAIAYRNFIHPLDTLTWDLASQRHHELLRRPDEE